MGGFALIGATVAALVLLSQKLGRTTKLYVLLGVLVLPPVGLLIELRRHDEAARRTRPRPDPGIGADLSVCCLRGGLQARRRHLPRPRAHRRGPGPPRRACAPCAP